MKKERKTKMEENVAAKITIGVCVMEKKVKCGSELFSAPMSQILDRLQAFGEFEFRTSAKWKHFGFGRKFRPKSCKIKEENHGRNSSVTRNPFWGSQKSKKGRCLWYIVGVQDECRQKSV
ncbi:uncharacterized protein LOC143890317 isoform X1 [Tasmannia lanceolata]|uniref:uncharacterized protein LOC143890317 isoform X1 n=1 Tax=Tasmannia lanceolata TaxID=3420 RepID=UPI0040649D0C